MMQDSKYGVKRMAPAVGGGGVTTLGGSYSERERTVITVTLWDYSGRMRCRIIVHVIRDTMFSQLFPKSCNGK